MLSQLLSNSVPAPSAGSIYPGIANVRGWAIYRKISILAGDQAMQNHRFLISLSILAIIFSFLAGTTAFAINNIDDSHYFNTGLVPQQSTTDATCGATWETAWHGSYGNSVAYGNGLYVIVGQEGTIITTTDWTTQARRISGVTNSLTSITWGNGRFVAVGRRGTIISSPDGMTWTSHPSGITNGDFYDVTWGNNQFIAVGDNGTILTSPDGVVWTFRISGTSAWLSGITHGGGLFVAVGSSTLNNTSSTILTSPDGVIWTLHNSGTTRTLRDVVWGNGLFVAVGEGSTIIYSPNGVTWITAISGGTDIDHVAWGKGLFVAAGYRTLTSPDGINWTTRATDSLDSLNWVNGLFVASGSGPYGTYGTLTSLDGLTWSDHSMGTNGYLNGIAWGNDLFVAVGTQRNSSLILTSSDLLSWTNRTLRPGYALNDVVFDISLFVAVGENGTILSSSDGLTRTPRAAGTNDLYGVTSGNGLFVAVGEKGTILTSPDGIDWSPQNAGTVESLRSVTWGNGLFVVAGGNLTGTILTSPDGMTWTIRAAAMTDTLWSVTWGNDLFVATASYWGGTQHSILTSPDGITWTPHAPGILGNFWNIAWSNGLFMVVSGSKILTSSNGVTWTSIDVAAGDIHGLTYAENRFVLTAGWGLVMYSNCSTQTLSVAKTGGSGVVTSHPNGINCGVTCMASFNSGTQVTLHAIADTGYDFSGWSGDCSSTNNTCTLIMDADKAITALFANIAPTIYPLTIATIGTGTGTVGGTGNYAAGATVTLTATPNAGSTFAGWSPNPCASIFAMPANDLTCIATFDTVAPTTHLLTVNKAGTGHGTVTGLGINCGGDCTVSYASGTEVTLTANPASGSTFTGWSGACSGTGNCTVTLNAAKNVMAIFSTPSQPTVFKTAAGTISWFYAAAFSRTPVPNSALPNYGDIGGLAFWTNAYLAGQGVLAQYRGDVYAITDFFVGSDEFQTQYPASLPPAQFVTALYDNMLGRAPDAGGLAFWVGLLDRGESRSRVLADFTNSDENRDANLIRKAALESFIAFIDADANQEITPQEAAAWLAANPNLDGAVIDKP